MPDCVYSMVAKTCSNGKVCLFERNKHNHAVLEPLVVGEDDESHDQSMTEAGQLVTTLASRDELKAYRMERRMKYKHGNGQSFYYGCRVATCGFTLVGKRCRLNTGQIFVYERGEHNHEEMMPDDTVETDAAGGSGGIKREGESIKCIVT